MALFNKKVSLGSSLVQAELAYDREANEKSDAAIALQDAAVKAASDSQVAVTRRDAVNEAIAVLADAGVV
jgi:hypothetical protein